MEIRAAHPYEEFQRVPPGFVVRFAFHGLNDYAGI